MSHFEKTESAETKWLNTSLRVIPAVMKVKFCHTAPFDTEQAGAGEGTAFIVDATRGYRHDVQNCQTRSDSSLDGCSQIDTLRVRYVRSFGVL